MDARYQGLLDMINGGGAGQAGETFQGGALSDLLNSLGIRPMGYRDRQAEQAPPQMLQPRMSSMAAPRGPELSPVPDQIQQMMPSASDYAYVAGRPDMAAPGSPITPAPDQIAELLRMLGLGPQQYAMSDSPRMPAGENYDPMARGAGVFSTGYGPR